MSVRNSKYWKDRLEIITAFANGIEVEHKSSSGLWLPADNYSFADEPEDYRIAKPKEKIPLEAEDWIKDGPWWVRSNEDDDQPVCVVRLMRDGIQFLSSEGALNYLSFRAAMNLQRRNATSDWMPCWKEKE